MRIGYVGSNLGLGTKSRTFRLAGFDPERARATSEENLVDVLTCLSWNAERGIGFFRMSSQLVPFASHPVAVGWDWRSELRPTLEAIGAFARERGMRLGTHPGQYVLPNSPRPEVVAASIAELEYHASVLDLMGAEPDARVQIHVGGMYGDREASLVRWIEAYGELSEPIRRRLAVENDERMFGLSDCLRLNQAVGVPVIFDVFHHSLLNAGEDLAQAYSDAGRTWGMLPLQIDYSSQNADRRFGAHTETLDEGLFAEFYEGVPKEADVMLEIKDKETSAMKALAVIDPSRGPYAKPETTPKPKGRGKKVVRPAAKPVREDIAETVETPLEGESI